VPDLKEEVFTGGFFDGGDGFFGAGDWLVVDLLDNIALEQASRGGVGVGVEFRDDHTTDARRCAHPLAQ
jgi:hypothetical protein